MRLKLQQWFLLQIFRLDKPGGIAQQSYDDDFNELRTVTSGGNRVVKRPEQAPLLLRAQIETQDFHRLRMFNAGDSPEAKMVTVCDERDLTRLGLLDALGLPSLDRNDRLGAIYDWRGNLVLTVKDPPGLYATMAQPTAFGLGRKQRLFEVTWESREQSKTT